jgi:hypothetical protein
MPISATRWIWQSMLAVPTLVHVDAVTKLSILYISMVTPKFKLCKNKNSVLAFENKKDSFRFLDLQLVLRFKIYMFNVHFPAPLIAKVAV